MASREIAELVGKDHRHVLADARTMLESLGINCAEFSAQYKDASGKSNPMFILPKRETLILVSGYSVTMRAKIIDRWQELEAREFEPVALSAASMFMQAAQVMLEMESRTAALEKRQITIEARLDEVADASGAILKVCPHNAESITRIRKRVGQEFGLSVFIIDEAMRQLPYSPKPAAIVLNDNEAAQGAHYAVFWRKDVTKMFKVFVAECKRLTPAFVRHPLIDTPRFRLAVGKEAS